jgi:Fe2+ or Zn2+ uptake regulation protein
MSLSEDNSKWLKRGRQRSAVARILRKPMTTTQICQAARAFSPRIQLRDVWYLMKQFKDRGLVTCLNPHHSTGKLYALTQHGQASIKGVFAIETCTPLGAVDWRKYAWLVRAKTRKLVFLEVARQSKIQSRSATEIRKALRETHAIGLNPTLRALKELEKKGLVLAKTGQDANRRLYCLTKTGSTLAHQINA